MNPVLRYALALPAIVFTIVGVAWLIAPSVVAPLMGMRLLEGTGLSTQIADLGSFFLTLGACIGIGAATDRRAWFYPGILMLVLATCGRVIAWAAHGAALALDSIAVEVVVVALLVLAIRSRRRDTSMPK